jgi:hypothetical protein
MQGDVTALATAWHQDISNTLWALAWLKHRGLMLQVSQQHVQQLTKGFVSRLSGATSPTPVHTDSEALASSNTGK